MLNWTNEDELWRIAAQNVPLRYRLWRQSLSIEQVEQMEPDVVHNAEWAKLKQNLCEEDKIWPFEFNRNTLAYRKGFVIIRKGKPISGLISLSS